MVADWATSSFAGPVDAEDYLKPAPFEYVRAESVGHAAELLAKYGDDAKIIAGGQSLMPMINFRLVRPAILVDINRIPDLDVVEEVEDRVRIKALVRHHRTAADTIIRTHIPLLKDVMRHVAHMTVRNRGTFCGSVCHADPAAEMPLVAQMLEGEVEISSVAGQRTLPVSEFLVDSLVNALEPHELVTGITVRCPTPGSGWAFEEFSRRHGDFALAAFAIVLRVDVEDAIREPRIGMAGIAATALRLTGLESVLDGRVLSDALLKDVRDWLRENLNPNTDLHASGDYRRSLSETLAMRAVTTAYGRAKKNRERSDA